MKRHTEWQDGLIEARWTSAGTPEVGSTYVFVTQFAGTRWDLPGRVTSWASPNGWTWKSAGGPFPTQGGFRLEHMGSETRVTMFSDSEPTGWMNMMRARNYKRSLTRLKAILETK